jgi:RNA polymerase sigma-70 factor (ECF subfamily)
MNHSPLPNPNPALAAAVGQALRSFLDCYEPLRPVLYRYCRYLTRSPWDAEDPVLDTLARAFASLGALIYLCAELNVPFRINGTFHGRGEQ